MKRELKRVHAYRYLQALIDDSILFRDAVNNLRDSIDLNVDREFGKEGTRESDLKKVRWLESVMYPKEVSKLNPEGFIELCEEFYIPSSLYEGIEHYIATGVKTRVLSNIDVRITNDLSALVEKVGGSICPPILLSMPHDISRESFNELWTKVARMKKDMLKFLEGVPKWENGFYFDRALMAYKAYEKGLKGNGVVESLYESGRIRKKSDFIDSNEPSKWYRRIQLQIDCLQIWEKLPF